KGSGLGLSMVYGFARQAGGTATIASVLGKGTTVSLYLQRAADQLESQPQVSLAEPPPIERLRILVVDDDDRIRNLAKEMLEQMGHNVADAASARSALEHLTGDCSYDLLLVDFAMPVMNGSEFATEARKLCPDVPILFITGYADNDSLRPWSAL